MNKMDLVASIKERVSCLSLLEKSKGGLYCCPYCGSGHGSNGTGAVKYYEESNTFACHACKQTGDVIDLFQQVNGINDFNMALSLLAQEIGEEMETPSNRTTSNEEQEGPDFSEYFKACMNNILDPEAVAYLKSRGISEETAIACRVGYDRTADPANATGGKGEKKHPCKRIIIPTSESHYTARSIEQGTKLKYVESKGGKKGVFNLRALHDGYETVFVVEGAFDALSCLEVGAPAIATLGAGSRKALIEHLKESPTESTLILCADNDRDEQTREKIKKQQEELAKELTLLNVPYIIADICGEYKDANEALVNDPRGFVRAIEEAKKTKPDNTSDYIDNFLEAEIEAFQGEIKTGFENLDKKANGLYPGLYCLAAISSLGKTTFLLQLADQIAEGGKDVIFFSLEQSKVEMVTKSIARTMAQNDPQTAQSSLELRRNGLNVYARIASADYKAKVEDRISIIEGNFNCDIGFIDRYVTNHINITKTKPVVIIDYLQILQPSEEGKTKGQGVREVIDTAVTQLKRLSRKHGLTIIVVSSVNRMNYLSPIDYESLKESGSIEYTCDVIWGLQLQIMSLGFHDVIERNGKTEERDFAFDGEKTNITKKRDAVRKAKAETPRRLELVCLKNRYGTTDYRCFFEYFPKYDLWRVDESAEEAERVRFAIAGK